MKKLPLLCLASLALSPVQAAAVSDPVAAVPSASSLPAPKPGMGQVVFFRPGGMGGAVKCTIRENGRMVGRVSGNRFYVIDAAPGAHTFTAKSEATDAVTVQVEPDETSFVKCKIAMGVMVGRPNLSPSEETEFAKSAAKLKPMEADKIAAEIAKDNGKLGGAAEVGAE